MTARYVVDITLVIEVKEQMLAAHESQRSWLRAQHGEDIARVGESADQTENPRITPITRIIG